MSLLDSIERQLQSHFAEPGELSPARPDRS